MNFLKTECRWCVFDKDKKPYVDVYTGGRSNDPDSWLSFEAATQLQNENREKFKWKGFFISQRNNNPRIALCVIDVDAHEQDVNPLADEILNLFQGTYIERSPSGRGYHIICNFELDRAPYDENGKRNYKINNHEKELEIYIGETTNKALTYTGDVCSETQDITDQTDQVLEFINRFMSDYETTRTRVLQAEGRYNNPPVEDGYIMERLNIARRSQFGNMFIKVYDAGDISDFGNDHSKADMYLANRLCFWLGPYSELIDEAFRSSHLMRDKWDENRGGETYGEMTIRKAIENREKYYEPPESGQAFNMNWGGVFLGEGVDTGTQTPDPTINERPITPEDILNMINEAELDNNTSDMISVFNLQCGTGKSTAIRLKIRQVIEANNGDGLIIATDSLDRMRDYVQPSDPELRNFFALHANQIAIMTHDNYAEVRITQRRCPVLIISTQRFIYLSKERIEELTRWENGNRSLLIVDEKPYFLKQISITEEHIRTVGTAVNMGIPINDPDKEEMSDFWNRILNTYLTNSIHQMLAEYATDKQNFIFWKPNYFDEDLFIKQFRLAQKHANELNNYRQRSEFFDIYSTVRTVMQLLFDGAVLEFRKLENGIVRYSISTLLDSFDLYNTISSKVIVLDGTADLSMEYQVFADFLDFRNCDEYRRDLSKLHIDIIQAPTGKMRLEYNSELRSRVIGTVHEYYDKIYQECGQLPVIFSYMFLKDQFNMFCDEQHFDWFGHIRGRNDYRQAQNIIQVGLNTFSLESYFLFELAQDEELMETLKRMDYKDTMPVIKEHIIDQNGVTQDAIIREILAELEQNIFRGTIRNSNNDNDYTFTLFCSHGNSNLINKIYARYIPLNAHISSQVAPFENDRDSIFKRAVLWHDTELREGDEYTMQIMADGINVRRRQLEESAREKNNQVFRRLLNDELIGERKSGSMAKYVKKKNWKS